MRAWVSLGLFVAVVLIGLAGADKPPPPGFVVWVVLAGLVAGGVWWRAPHWNTRLTASRDGATVGLLAGIVLVAMGGEPAMDLPAWLPFATVAVLTLLGAAGGWLLGLLLAGANHSAGGET